MLRYGDVSVTTGRKQIGLFCVVFLNKGSDAAVHKNVAR